MKNHLKDNVETKTHLLGCVCAQWVESFLGTHKALGFIPRTMYTENGGTCLDSQHLGGSESSVQPHLQLFNKTLLKTTSVDHSQSKVLII